MDHQQNYEFNDPNAFGFISSFSGSDNFMLAQPQQVPQQLNGKAHDHPSELPPLTPMQSFDPDHTETSYLAQPPTSIFHLPEAPQQTIVHYPTSTISYHSMTPIESDLSMNSQKDSLFEIESPSAAVPANIIQEVAHSSIIDVIHPSHQLTEPLLSTDETAPITAVNNEIIPEPQPLSESLPEDSEETPPVVVSPEQNNMMQSLGIVRKQAPLSNSKKRRRRILREDDSDEESDLKKELQLISPVKDKEKMQNDAETEDSSPDSDSDDASLNDPGALRVRSLLKSAVIIQGPVSKKRKKRVLESDDEDEMQTSVDDIGLVNENDNEIEDELFNGDIIVSDTGFESIVGEQVIPIENPIIQVEFAVPASPGPLKTETCEEIRPENELKTLTQIIVKSEKDDKGSVTLEEPKRIIKTEDGEVDPSMSVEAILENIKPMADDDAFFKADEKSDDSDVQFVSNEEYFGTPDLSKQHSSGSQRRGPRTGGSRKRSHPDSSRRKRANKYEKDFVEGSSESEDTTYSESSSSSSDSSVEEIRPRGKPIMKKSPVIVQTKSFSVTRVPIKKKIAKKDRFYDRSRDIPNDVYFGDVKVPLHVLHTRWSSDVESSNSSEPEQFPYAKPSNNRFSSNPSMNRTNFVNRTKPSFSYIEQTDDPKLSGLKEFAKITGIKINYARLFDGIRSTDDKCMLIRRILAQKGLQGEPTIAKCKQLRLDLQAKRESAELDKSLIIRAEGRTRRATRNVGPSRSPFSSQPSTSSAVVQPETLQTLSKIRRVVDSDSE